VPSQTWEVDVTDYGEAGSTARTEQPRQKTYAEFLELGQLLSLQRTLAEPPVHDEMLFVIVHQAHELWFKQMLHELRALIAHIDAGAWERAELTTDRLAWIVRVLICQVDVLRTMRVEEFHRFRAGFGSASGMQSEQFKAIEELAAGVAAGPLFREPARSRERRLAERLLHFDTEMVRWRVHHMELAREMIGGAEGTGGSAGARYLQGTLDKRFFPELWTARVDAT